MIDYREMTESDVAVLAELEKVNFAHPWSYESLRKEIENDASIFVVAQIDGNVAGYAGMYIIADEGDITNVVVSEEYRNKGIGHGIMQFIIQKAKLRNVNAITLEVRVSNEAAIHLYKTHGFVDSGIRPGFYDKPKEDAMIMWHYLP